MESSINKSTIIYSLNELSNILDLIKEDKDFLNEISKIVSTIVDSLKRGNKILFMGNGGSAGDSQHMAAEFICRFIKDRESIPGLSLTTDTSVLTAISNDYGFEKIFSRQIEGLGKKFDTVVAFSTSGNSKNIILGLQKARQLGLNTIGLTGKISFKYQGFLLLQIYHYEHYTDLGGKFKLILFVKVNFDLNAW